MIVIKSMTQLPEHCYECPCHDGESGYCQADKEHRYSDYRPFWCPLEEVKIEPKLLIDTDEVVKKLCNIIIQRESKEYYSIKITANERCKNVIADIREEKEDKK